MRCCFSIRVLCLTTGDIPLKEDKVKKNLKTEHRFRNFIVTLHRK